MWSWSVLISRLSVRSQDYEFGEDSVTIRDTGVSYRISDYSGKLDRSGRPMAIQLASLLQQAEFFVRQARTAASLPTSLISLIGLFSRAWTPVTRSGLRIHVLVFVQVLRRHGTLAEFATEAGAEEPYQYVFIAGTACINLVFS